MAVIPTVRIYKGDREMVVNASDVAAHEADGWKPAPASQEPAVEPPTAPVETFTTDPVTADPVLVEEPEDNTPDPEDAGDTT